MKRDNTIRAEIEDRYSSVQDFAAKVGVAPITVERWINRANLGETAYKERVNRALILAAEKPYTRKQLKQVFKQKMQGDYKILAAEVQKTLPHCTEKRLRHYLFVKQDARRTCPTYRAVVKALGL